MLGILDPKTGSRVVDFVRIAREQDRAIQWHQKMRTAEKLARLRANMEKAYPGNSNALSSPSKSNRKKAQDALNEAFGNSKETTNPKSGERPICPPPLQGNVFHLPLQPPERSIRTIGA